MATQQTPNWAGLGRRPIILVLVSIGTLTQPFFAQDASNRLLVPSVAASGSDNKRGVQSQIEDLHPFTHFASIPANSDPASIKFKKVKATKVFTKRKSTMDSGYCQGLQFTDPGGSMYCPYVQDESPALAYEVTYSFTGQPLASDEYGNRNFTFQVYFRPEELPQALRSVLSAGKVQRAELATYFSVTTSRLPIRAVVIDEARSSFCDGNYLDGNWIHNDPKCQDKVTLKTVTVPSDYITIQVEPVSPRGQESVASR
jgi:hypothetical protein